MRDLVLMGAPPGPAGAWSKCRYQLFSNDQMIGSLLSSRRLCGTEKGFELGISDEMKVDIHRLFGGYHLHSEEELQLDQHGLAGYRLTAEEDGRQSKVSLLRNQQDISWQVQSKAGGVVEQISTALDSFDCTSETAAWLFLCEGQQVQTLRVLDLDDLEIRQVRYVYEGKQHVQLAEGWFDCHKVTFASDNKTGCMYLVEDNTGIWLGSESGRDNDGDYRIELVEYQNRKG
ncbi:hypothetical protein [Bowmanella denitrificans]|uniref:hypothetical protein n=1 Tax=Bowmanella denitrificans TaxID=366582 RepID=UPI000C9A4CC2|nr:hypothetical protein [Bowmanella denitrificans]